MSRNVHTEKFETSRVFWLISFFSLESLNSYSLLWALAHQYFVTILLTYDTEHELLACEQVLKWSRAKKEKKHGLGEPEDCFDATHPWHQILVSWSDSSLITDCWQVSDEYFTLLYKHQWNTSWAFVQKLDIFTCENNMLSSHVKISPLLWLHNKSRLSHQKTI